VEGGNGNIIKNVVKQVLGMLKAQMHTFRVEE